MNHENESQTDFLNDDCGGSGSVQSATGRKETSTQGNSSGHGSVLEQSPSNGALHPAQLQSCSGPRILVRITSVRKRLLDEDNLCEKYLVDLLRNSGVIFDDSPDQTRIEIRQVKATKTLPEVNLIEVFEIQLSK